MEIHMSQEKNFKTEIILFGQFLYRKNLVAGKDGNISIRKDSRSFFITASGIHKGFLKNEQILEMDLDGKVLSGNMKPSTETMLHMETYRRIPECRAIIHAHSPWATAAGLRNDHVDLTALAEGRLLFGSVEVVPYRAPGTTELAILSAEAAVRSKIHILKAHGVVSWGKNLMDAFCLIEALEQNIKILAMDRLYFR